MTDWSGLERVIRGIEERGVVGVSILAPDGERWSHRGDRKFRAASTVKIPLMIEIYRSVERGERALDDVHVLTAEDKAVGSGVLLELHDGIAVTVNDLVYLMMAISDNTATNVLIDMAGMDAVNALMRELGMSGSNLNRKMKGRPAIEGEIENFATPDDYVTVVRALLDGGAASASSCAAMLAMLRKQQNMRRIARYLPEGTEWGSKTGSIAGVTNDVGFIRKDGATLIVSVYCEGLPSQHVGEEAIGAITRAACQATGIVATLDA